MATVYKSGELHLLQDKSQGYEDTWSFIRRALEECVKLDNMFESNAKLAKDVVAASVSTVGVIFFIIFLFNHIFLFTFVFLRLKTFWDFRGTDNSFLIKAPSVPSAIY